MVLGQRVGTCCPRRATRRFDPYALILYVLFLIPVPAQSHTREPAHEFLAFDNIKLVLVMLPND